MSRSYRSTCQSPENMGEKFIKFSSYYFLIRKLVNQDFVIWLLIGCLLCWLAGIFLSEIISPALTSAPDRQNLPRMWPKFTVSIKVEPGSVCVVRSPWWSWRELEVWKWTNREFPSTTILSMPLNAWVCSIADSSLEEDMSISRQLTHCDLVMPYSNRDLDQHRFRPLPETMFELSPVTSCDIHRIHLRAISQ